MITIGVVSVYPNTFVARHVYEIDVGDDCAGGEYEDPVSPVIGDPSAYHCNVGVGVPDTVTDSGVGV